ncbi:hypothetical protein BDW22DRAFT_1360717 [Trametopsis cervina]|nr:hypothetical protein BDW22DRAFT_1360717 [Trametopsis cervina]
MPYMHKPVKRRNGYSLDDLAITRLQAMSKVPFRHTVGHRRDSIVRRFQLLTMRDVIRVRIGGRLDSYDISSYAALSELASVSSRERQRTHRSNSFIPRANSEPPYCAPDEDGQDVGGLPTSQNYSSYPGSPMSQTSTLLGSSGSSSSCGSISPSMSRRRIASNRPALDSYVALPPPWLYDAALGDVSSSDVCSDSGTPSLCSSVSDLSLPDVPNLPRTPAGQVMQAEINPPQAPRQANVKAKRSAPLCPTFFLEGQNSAAQLLSCYPFTPLEDQTSSQALPRTINIDPVTGLDVLLLQRCRIQHTPDDVAPRQMALSSSFASSPRSQTGKSLRRRPLSALPRRLSYTRQALGSGSSSPRLISPRRLSLPQSGGLASPVILDASTRPLTTARPVEPSPLQYSTGAASPSYFNLFR